MNHLPTSMFSRTLCTLLTITVAFTASFQPAVAEDGKKGKKGKKAKAGEEAAPKEGPFQTKASEVARISYQAPGRVVPFTQTGPKLWVSAGTRYTETDRDEFSVYLNRAKSEDRVQIDLYKRTITFFNQGEVVTYSLLTAAGAQ